MLQLQYIPIVLWYLFMVYTVYVPTYNNKVIQFKNIFTQVVSTLTKNLPS